MTNPILQTRINVLKNQLETETRAITRRKITSVIEHYEQEMKR